MRLKILQNQRCSGFFTQRSGFSARRFLFRSSLFLFLFLITCGGCVEKPREPGDEKSRVKSVNADGYTIPVFGTASEQLNYAKSLFSSPQEKSAALKVLIDRFPKDREKQGEARLELAYMHLGDDFRLADPAACRRALAAYEAITREFADLPAVRAKAYWYMGWIYTDLLKDKKRGIALYTLLAEKYPENSFSRISPVPWLRLIFPNPQKKPYTADDEHTHSWGGLALLEIVRNSDNGRERMAAFEKLWREHRGSLITGYALKEMLRRCRPSDRLVRRVRDYTRKTTVNPALKKDLTMALARLADKQSESDR